MSIEPNKLARSPIRVLVVDDSALMRKLLTDLLQSDPEIEVVGAAKDAYMARDLIKQLNPDVLTLDVEMPKMDGLSFLSNLMRLRPMPVVMVSSLTERGADVTMKALNLGAVDFVSKPKIDLEHGMEHCAIEIIDKVKAASVARVAALARTAGRPDCIQPEKPVSVAKPARRHYRTTDQLIAIGASTGGTEAIKEVLERLRADSPGVVITQHIPPLFSRSFADRMNRCSELTVCEAEDGQLILPGHAFIAPGGRHLKVVRDGARYRCKLSDAEPVNRHRPSVDVLFESVADSAGPNTVGVILTGMGNDGAAGLKKLRDLGAHTIAQDEKSCVVWGMPRVATEIGAAELVLPLGKIADKLNTMMKN
ncbi:MAG TPA: chemotaxis response regulator protein-glutamate methylesterase [Chromatiales bacterium]|nr:chemotaxis response regulator protein-glutamate methylesterase [Chromatiales bacterium]